MKQILILLFILGASLSTWAQTAKGNGKIKGQVVDAQTNEPVEFANIVLIDKATEKTIDGAMCDMEGKFELSKVPEGTFNLSVTFIGYETKVIENLIIDGKKAEIDLGSVKLSTGAKVLNEVVVEGQRELIEEKVDRTVYNAEQDATTRGGDASDVLKRVPMLSVDMDGNVSMRGNSNITVLINNKPSTVMASSIADALKQIPADQIKSVEVITSPSAKYDAEGSAGIINIITKKNNLEGATLNINGGIGIRGSNLGLNGNYRKGKMGFSLGGFGRAGYNVKGSFRNETRTRISDNGTDDPSDDVWFSTGQFAETRRNDVNGRYTLGWDYDINERNYLAASVRFGIRNGNNYQDQITRETPIGTIAQVWDSKTADKSNNVDVSLDYTKTFEKPQRELSFSTQFSRNNRNNDFFNSYYNDLSVIDSLGKNVNTSFNQEITAQLDYQTPIKDNQMIEIGAKNISRKVSSDYSTFYGVPGGSYTEDRQRQNNNNALNYDQNVTSGYLSYILTTKNSISVKAGARYEYTTINASLRTPNPEVGDPKIPSYGVLVPSLNLSKKLKNGNTVKFAYNRRIQRPSIQFLNPNRQASNPLYPTQGNPNLDPEYTNNYEIGYSSYIKSVTLNLSGFVRNTRGSIQSFREVLSADTILTTYRNMGKEDAYGVSIFTGVNLGKLTLNGGGDIYYAMLDNNKSGDEAASNNGWVWSGRMFGNYSLPKDWAIQFFGFYRGNRVNLQGSQGGFGTYSLGFRKEFNEKKASIGLAAENFFTTSMRIKSETHTPTIDQYSVNTMRNMSVRVTFTYRIGKMGFDNQRQRRRKSVNNDDMKDGGGGGNDMDMNNNQGGMGGQGGGGMGGQRGGNGMPQFNSAGNAASDSTLVADVNAVVDVTGKWSYTIETPQGPNNGSFEIKKEGDVYSGSTTNTRNNTQTPFETVTVNGNELTASYSMSFGGNTVEITLKGIITDNVFTGVMNFGQFRTTPIKATRQ